MDHAYAIFHSYLSSTARFKIVKNAELEKSAKESSERLEDMSKQMSNPNFDFDTKLYQPIMDQIVPQLQDAWLDFIKDDVLKYTR